MEKLYATVADFLDERCKKGIPFLLGYSGGPDSLALLQLLLEYRKGRPLPFALAHVDHGWREESAAEAKQIDAMAKDMGIVCHIKTLSPKTLKGNLEAACREERLSFFSKLCAEFGYQAVMLGHHADDLAETVLKRVFEGASLERLSGMKREGKIDGMQVWRPLLPVKKKEILGWLSKRGLAGFHDRTNDDVRFLRAKMRKEILPYLSDAFGKEIVPALCHLGEEAVELDSYMQDRIAPCMKQCVEGLVGIYLEAVNLNTLPLFELNFLVKNLASKGGFPISRDALATAAALIQRNTSNKCITIGSGALEKKLYIDKGRILLPNGPFLKLPDQPVQLLPGKEVEFGSWAVKMEKFKGDGNAYASADWRSLWKGAVEILLPQGVYQLAAPKLNWQDNGGGTLAKRWSSAGVPAIFRSAVPVILENGAVVHEFLSGSARRTELLPSRNLFKIRIRWRDKVSG